MVHATKESDALMVVRTGMRTELIPGTYWVETMVASMAAQMVDRWVDMSVKKTVAHWESLSVALKAASMVVPSVTTLVEMMVWKKVVRLAGLKAAWTVDWKVHMLAATWVVLKVS